MYQFFYLPKPQFILWLLWLLRWRIIDQVQAATLWEMWLGRGRV